MRTSFTSSAPTSPQATPFSPAGFPLLCPHPSLVSHPSSASSGFLFPHISAVLCARRTGALDLLLPFPTSPPPAWPGREPALESASVCTGCGRARRAGGAQPPAEPWAVDRSDEAETWRPRASEPAEPEPDDAAWLLTARARGPEDPRCGHHSAVFMVYSSSVLPAV